MFFFLELLVKDVMYVPELESSLLPVKVLAKINYIVNYIVTFKGDTYTTENEISSVPIGKIENNLCELVCYERANVL